MKKMITRRQFMAAAGVVAAASALTAFLQLVNLFHLTDKQNEQFEIVHKITL